MKKSILTILVVFVLTVLCSVSASAEEITSFMPNDDTPFVEVTLKKAWREGERVFLEVEYENGMWEYLWTDSSLVFHGIILYGNKALVASKENCQIVSLYVE